MTHDAAPERPDFDAMRRWRRHLHQNPEPGFAEHQTAAFVAGRLEEFGLTVTRGLGGTGVVAQLVVGDAARGPRIALRADMDALPMQERTGLPHASVNAGCMHACGHDGHTAMLLGGADLIARRARAGRIAGHGTVTFVFQPAEEVGGSDSGAQRMIADGLFDRFPADRIFGIHNGPTEAEGQMYFREGPFMCSSDKLEIVIRGAASHGATPHLAQDASLAMASTIMALHSIVSQNVPPLETAIFNIGQVQAGQVFNVIPSEARITACIRVFEAATAQLVHRRIREVVTAQAASFGCTGEVIVDPGYPSVVNEAATLAAAARTATRLFGAGRVVMDAARVTASEDFAFYQRHCPGSFFLIGNGDNGFRDGQPIGPCSVHSPFFDFNDKILTTGAEFWAGLIEDSFQQGAPR
ncbi:MAG: amidohydrolase [Paracoccus sp. (in: a-proteobacteria)]|uniref:amidohydrolase n=1 Tax=Paracoccus sp. TaxID=267 RepID=UPI003918AEAE